jgi:hypothetical protein
MDPDRRVEPTSQAEYAGSIPVIGSALTSINTVRRASSSCWPGVVLPGLVAVAIAARYKGYRYPIEVIGHAVWLYHRFSLSLRDVEELMVARGVVLTYETIRCWCAKFGPDYANQLRGPRPRPGDKWHLAEVFVKINGATHYLWRAVDQHGNVPCCLR